MGYNVGLDIGTTSVGWVAMDDNFKVKRAKGKELIGVRLFSEAEHAADRRGKRSNRRRLSRRHWRLSLLNNLFDSELQKIDSEFLNRLKYSYVHENDEGNKDNYFGGYVFGNVGTDKKFHDEYKTIYHLRQKLMTDTKKHDLREVYLAVHHIVKYRGHFLLPGKGWQIERPVDLGAFNEALVLNAGLNEDSHWEIRDKNELLAALIDDHVSKSERVENALKALSFNTKEDKAALEAILKAIVGLTMDLSKIMYTRTDKAEKKELKALKLDLSSDDYDNQFTDVASKLTSEEVVLMESIKAMHDGVKLKAILGDAPSLSDAMVASYVKHQENLKWLRENVKPQITRTEFSKMYTDYLVDPATAKKSFISLVEKLDIDLETKENVVNELISGAFLPKQRTKDNGLIPHQIHVAELEIILKNQAKYYPFLAEEFDKIISLVEFRVPYYVGPMATKADTEFSNGDSTNHWMEKNPGFEKTAITPWNFQEVVNTDKAAVDFIERLTGNDTYLIGEKTVPRNSLLYQKYMVLSELNNVRVNGRRLDVLTKQAIFNDVFKEVKTVTKKRLEDYLQAAGKHEVVVSGLSEETKFATSLSSYIDLSKNFSREEFLENPAYDDLLERIIEIQTVFEDSDIAARELTKVLAQYGVDDANLVNKLAGTHYTGWGKLSRKLLTAPMVNVALDDGVVKKHSIIDVLYHTQWNLMEILKKEDFGVEEWISNENMKNLDEQKLSIQDQINELTASPAVKRGIKQAFNVLDDLVKVLGEEPDNVYVEFARNTDDGGRTVSRKKRLVELYKNKNLKGEFDQLRAELEARGEVELQNDRLYLYYRQLGKDMYTGKPIDLSKISSNYDIDHVIPQAFVKDDSLDNKVLVSRPENARKSDSPEYTTEVRANALTLWNHLKNVGLMSAKMYRNLTRTGDFGEGQKENFIARQLVETRQIIKNVANLIENHFDNTDVYAIRAEVTGDMRRMSHVLKNRNVNDYHHAQDALLVASAGLFIQKQFVNNDSEFKYNAFNYYTKQRLRDIRESKHGQRKNPYGFVVGSMQKENDFWTEENTEYLRHVMNYKNMLVTRKPEYGTGALYKETIQSADDNPKLIPVNKQHADTSLYGGYTYMEAAYLCLVKTKKSNLVVKVSVMAANEISAGNLTLEEYLNTVDVLSKTGYERVLIKKMPLKQLIQDGNSLFYLVSANYKHNAQQLWLPQPMVGTLNDESVELLQLFEYLTSEVVIKRFEFYEKSLQRTATLKEYFELLSDAGKQEYIKLMLEALHDDTAYKKPNQVFKKELGLKVAEWTAIEYKSGIKLSDNAYLIFKSPTGVFETRTQIKDL